MSELEQALIEKLVELGYSRKAIAARGLETVLREAGVIEKKATGRKAARKEIKLPEPKNSFQAWLVGEMRQRGLSQARLAEALGLTTGAISFFFTKDKGAKSISVQWVVGLSRAFQVSPLVVLSKAGLWEEPAENGQPVIERTEFLSPENQRVIQLIVDALLGTQEGS
jgi:transcriptional regulator